jgi:hypothetical protein
VRPELGNAEIQAQRAGLHAEDSVADAGQLGSALVRLIHYILSDCDPDVVWCRLPSLALPHRETQVANASSAMTRHRHHNQPAAR